MNEFEPLPLVELKEGKIGDLISDGNSVFRIVNASDVMTTRYNQDVLVMYKMPFYQTLEEIKSKPWQDHMEYGSTVVMMNYFGHSFGKLTEEQAKEFFKGKTKLVRSVGLVKLKE